MRPDRRTRACILGLCILGIVEATSWKHIKSVDNFIENIIKCKRIPGLSLAVVKDGETILSKGYGYADLEAKNPVTSGTKFCVASLTKAFTATLLAGLLHERGLNWDTPIRTILGAEFYIHDDYRTLHMSLRDVLSQKAGFPAYNGLWEASSMTPEEILKHLPFLKEEYGFRTKFTYSNILIILAGVVAEKLGGARWSELVEQRILKPLNMTQTTFAGEATEGRGFARSYKTHEGGTMEARPWIAVRQINSTFSAASICSTSEDIAKWMEFHIDGADQVKYAKLLKETYEPQTSLPPDWNQDMVRPTLPRGVYLDYGLGWFTGRYGGYEVLHHYGFMYDYFTSMHILPYHKYGVFTSINGAAKPGEMGFYTLLVNFYVLDLLLGEEPLSTPEAICSYDPFRLEANDRTANYGGGIIARAFFRRNLSPYVGTYGNDIFGNLTVFINHTTYTLHAIYGKYGRLQLDLFKDDEFSIDSELDWTLFCEGFENFGKFTFKKDGTVDAVSLPCIEPKEPPKFHRDHRLPEVASPNDKGSQPHVACIQSSSNSWQVSKTLVSVALLLVCVFMWS